MKRLLLRLTAVVAAGVIALGAIVLLGFQATASMHKPVFRAIVAEDADTFLELCTPELRKEIDRPVLLAWMRGMNEALGECQFEGGKQFNLQFASQSGVNAITATGQMQFEKGIAEAEIVFVGGKMNGFNIDTDLLAKGWFTGPEDATMYKDQAERFLTGLMQANHESIVPMMHPELRKAAPDSKLSEITAIANELSGGLDSMEASNIEFTNAGNDELTVTFVVEGKVAPVTATATYTFIGMKAHLTAFNVFVAE